MIPWNALPIFGPMIVDTLVFTFRILAGVMSVILALDWWRYRGTSERPPYNRRSNQIAWNWACAGMIVGATSFVALDFNYRQVTGQTISDLFVMIVWWCWANAATVRMSARAERPRFVYYGASIFIIGGSLYALLTGA